MFNSFYHLWQLNQYPKVRWVLDFQRLKYKLFHSVIKAWKKGFLKKCANFKIKHHYPGFLLIFYE